ncbi:FAS1-like dehydratase domain-containing protein [Ancylobacter polymorphus]|uniref:MaoC family dehydratase N-terminal domain-containing protein n=1 Tax=Ancylobacter polymorphus TaxID=223390 RepID=A0A9E6ZX10_9HYPH|nr:MaoC family dehydratase N-terminal domain-containing protein [Ancylobacter polymorphus]UOK73304.1 MaoC family dehydratase N-terminal domain-containing protein [Ancylobacter polymorphus]
MSGSAEIDIDHLKQWIGHEETSSEQLTQALVQRFLATLDMPADEVALNSPAPQLIHWCLAQKAAATSELGEDGHPRKGGFLPPVPLPRRMWAGGELTFHADPRIGEVVTKHSRISDVTVKEGRTGVLCFVRVDHEISADGRPVLSETQDIVYRDATSTPSPEGAAAPALEGAHRQEIMPTPALLFRYSALTFNGHRIHYDNPYARDVEGYPGLVVHGPLQATLLLNFAARLRGRALKGFSFRGASPVFDTAPFHLNAEEPAGDVMKLWTARANGPPGMMAEARWT